MKKGIIVIGALATGFAGGFVVKNYYANKVIQEKSDKINKFKSYYNILNKWINAKNEGKRIDHYFIQNHYSNIAIYGMGELGSLLYNDLKASGIIVQYAIDSNPSSTNSELNIYGVDDELPKVDAIIVTPVFAFDEIEQKLQNVIDCPIISLEEVVFSIS